MKALLVLAVLTFAAPAPRTVCTHGCESKYCKRTVCGKVCKMGPHCRGCWKVK